ncbi:Hypothetical protein (plasmid) [Pseudomonas putida]|nr:Hypothetical protein [Pseudomonas putida]
MGWLARGLSGIGYGRLIKADPQKMLSGLLARGIARQDDHT